VLLKKKFEQEEIMKESAVAEAPLLITLEQAAQRLAISRRTLERLMAAGEFPAPLKLGRSARVEAKDVDAYCVQLRARRIDAANTTEVRHG
jgi:excisionase family DNA binding protein